MSFFSKFGANRREEPTELSPLSEELVPLEETRGSRWSTVLLMVGAALVGASAVAIWNRRTIAGLKSQFDTDVQLLIETRRDGPVATEPTATGSSRDAQTADEIF
ncbi:MAG: hypothetical protein ACYDC6_11670 [Acidobacteriaceae bacterium]